jgi:hypothetical protein
MAALGHLVGRGVAGMPLLRKPRVILHGPAWAKLIVLAYTVWADSVASTSCQSVNPGLPFMLPAAIMNAAWAPQPHPLMALVGKTTRRLAQVALWVPQALDELVFGVCQRFLPLVVEPRACDKICKCYS